MQNEVLNTFINTVHCCKQIYYYYILNYIYIFFYVLFCLMLLYLILSFLLNHSTSVVAQIGKIRILKKYMSKNIIFIHDTYLLYT